MSPAVIFSDPHESRLRAKLVRADRPQGRLLICVHGGGCNGEYFDLPGYSVAHLAASQGFDVLMVHRPGYGGSSLPRTATPIREAAALLPAFVERAANAHKLQSRAVVAIGHSIGGAVLIDLAASGRLPLTALAISGIGARPTPASLDRLGSKGAIRSLHPEALFGPVGTYDWRAPRVLRKAAEPWIPDEVAEVFVDWPQRFPALASKIDIPVHWRLSENESIWAHDAADLNHIRQAFGDQVPLDLSILSGGGHVYELHNRGAAHVEQQLGFLARWGAAQ